MSVAGSRVDVALVHMPFGAIERPSLALGILGAGAARAGIEVAGHYGNLRFAELVGLRVYHLVAVQAPSELIGGALFAEAAFREGAGPTRSARRARVRRAILGSANRVRTAGFSSPAQALDALEEAEGAVAGFVDELAQRVLERQPRVVGCSSTFDQHVPSLALLRRVRELAPEVVTLIGGANCEAEMGYATVRAFDWVDVGFSGEADLVFPALCRVLLEHGRRAPGHLLPPGTIDRAGAAAPPGTPAARGVVADLDRTPVPDFDDYFAALERSPLRDHVDPGIAVETSRGCWWGAKSHCTFCGLNGEGMAFRAKSRARVLDELDQLGARHGCDQFYAADNILDPRHLRDVMPVLAERERPVRVFYEVKTNLRREQVALLARAGVRWVQPGVEALHDELLALMAKGATAAINIQFLRWAREHGIATIWSFITGFPGEDDAWHAETAALLPLLTHVQAPKGMGRLRYDRFSAYHQDAARWGLDLVPAPAYREVFPVDAETAAELAYFFERADDADDALERAGTARPGHQALRAEVNRWRDLWKGEPPLLARTDVGDDMRIVDTRPIAPERLARLSPLPARVLRALDVARPRADLLRTVAADGGARESDAAVLRALGELVERKLVAVLGARALALPLAGDVPAFESRFPGGTVRLRPIRRPATGAAA